MMDQNISIYDFFTYYTGFGQNLRKGEEIYKENLKNSAMTWHPSVEEITWNMKSLNLSPYTVKLKDIDKEQQSWKCTCSCGDDKCKHIAACLIRMIKEKEPSPVNADISLDEVYQSISRAINIAPKREKYTEIYNTVRNAFIDALKENEFFKVLYCDLFFSGSYPDNLKVSNPDEFDLIIRLRFPFDHLVKIHPDTSNKGNVNIDLSQVLTHLEKIKNTNMSAFLQKMVKDKKYFLLIKFQSWLEGLFTKYLTKIDKVLVCNGEKYLLNYSKNGPAHTIGVVNGTCKLSIDFVPGFRFENSKSISCRKLTKGYWDAIPLPKYPSFKCSYAEAERDIIRNKNNLKHATRLLKKYRDMNSKLSKLKSYYIKTLFLLHDEEVGNEFWKNESIGKILNIMFEKLETALSKKEIRWFWDPKVNLLQHLKETQIESMYHEVRNTRKVFIGIKSADSIFNIFLTKAEQNEMELYTKK